MSQPFKALSPSMPRVPELDYFPSLVNPLNVAAGPNQDVVGSLTVTMAGSVNPVGTDVVWTLISGPGTATFDQSTVLTTNISVSEIGDYGFRLTASNDYWDKYDDVAISFTAAGVCPVQDETPHDYTVTAPDPFFFDITLVQPAPTTIYQWQIFDGGGWVDLVDGANPYGVGTISGATAIRVDFTNSTGMDQATFQCITSAPGCATETSMPGVITVNP